MKVGIDLVAINRIEKIYNKRKEKFLKKILTQKEIDVINKISKEKRKIEKLAGIFALKEAIIKCFNGKIYFKDFSIQYEESGKPFCIINNKKISASISHDRDYAVAIAILLEE